MTRGTSKKPGLKGIGESSANTAPAAQDAGRRLERAYNAAREQTALVKPDGTVVSNIYDSAGRIAAVVAVRGDETERRDLAYDQAGRLQSVRSGYAETGYCYDSFLQIGEDSGGLHTDFEYDEDFRVSKTTYSSYWLGGSDPLAQIGVSYAYEANGNRLGGEYDAQDRQLAFGGATYAYDLNGSMTNRNGVALAWNLFGRLMSVGDVQYWRDEQQRLCYKGVWGETLCSLTFPLTCREFSQTKAI